MPKEQIDMTHLSKEVTVKLLQTSGCKSFSLDVIEDDIASGAPVNPDGTINLFDYAAWLYVGGVL